MKESPPISIMPGDAHWPRLLAERLGESLPPKLSALVDEAWFAHITPGGQMEQLAKEFSI